MFAVWGYKVPVFGIYVCFIPTALRAFLAAGVPFCRLLVSPFPINFSFDASLHLFRLPLCVRLALIDLQPEEHVTFLSLGEHLNSLPQITHFLIIKISFSSKYRQT